MAASHWNMVHTLGCRMVHTLSTHWAAAWSTRLAVAPSMGGHSLTRHVSSLHNPQGLIAGTSAQTAVQNLNPSSCGAKRHRCPRPPPPRRPQQCMPRSKHSTAFLAANALACVCLAANTTLLYDGDIV
eukprot:50335-Chlamydomonas_euryale.AAC.6